MLPKTPQGAMHACSCSMHELPAAAACTFKGSVCNHPLASHSVRDLLRLLTASANTRPTPSARLSTKALVCTGPHWPPAVRAAGWSAAVPDPPAARAQQPTAGCGCRSPAPGWTHWESPCRYGWHFRCWCGVCHEPGRKDEGCPGAAGKALLIKEGGAFFPTCSHASELNLQAAGSTSAGHSRPACEHV